MAEPAFIACMNALNTYVIYGLPLYFGFVGFQDVTAVVMKSTVFWEIMCSPLKVNRHLGETYRLHFHGLKISRTRNQNEMRW
jgi:hypothetical protein